LLWRWNNSGFRSHNSVVLFPPLGSRLKKKKKWVAR
jgi:hypothetical protein